MNKDKDNPSPAPTAGQSTRPRRRKLRRPRRGPFIAVDFDSQRLHLARGEHGTGGTRIDHVAMELLPADLAIDDPEAVGRFLAAALRKHRMGARGVIMNVRRGQVVLKPMVLPQPDEDSELAAMVQFQLGKALSIEPEETVIDYAIENHEVPTEGGEPPGGVEILAAAVKQPIVDYYRKVAEVAGVRLLRLGLRPYANTRAVDASGLAEGTESVALVNVTADETEVDVIAGQTLSFSRSAVIRIPRGDDDGQGKAESGASVPTPVPPEQSAAAGSTGGSLTLGPVEAIANEAARSLQSFYAVQRGRRIEKIIVSGSTGIEPQIADKLALRLRLPCVLYEPGPLLSSRAVPAEVGGYISAIGLAVGDHERHFAPIDFCNPKRPKVKRDRRKLRRSLVAAAVALLATMLIMAAVNERREAEAELSHLQQQIAQQREPLREAARQQSRLTGVRQWIEADRPWAEMLAHIASLFPPADEAYISGLTARADGRIEFTLMARDTSAYDRLARGLRNAGYHVAPGRNRTEDDPFGYTYSVDMLVRPEQVSTITLETLEPVERRDNDLYRAGSEAEVVGYFESERGSRGGGGGRR